MSNRLFFDKANALQTVYFMRKKVTTFKKIFSELERNN
jgi:hypothetical protein